MTNEEFEQKEQRHKQIWPLVKALRNGLVALGYSGTPDWYIKPDPTPTNPDRLILVVKCPLKRARQK